VRDKMSEVGAAGVAPLVLSFPLVLALAIFITLSTRHRAQLAARSVTRLDLKSIVSPSGGPCG
jgi:hypothetical protein